MHRPMPRWSTRLDLAQVMLEALETPEDQQKHEQKIQNRPLVQARQEMSAQRPTDHQR